MRLFGHATTLLSCAFLPVVAQGQDSDAPRRFGGIGIGWSRPLGKVTGMSDLVQFSSPVAAKDLYKSSLVFHAGAGRRVGRWVLELALDARIPRLTNAGQALVNQTHPDSGTVDLEYASFEVGAGRTVGSPGLAVFGGVGVGLALMQLSSGSSVEPHNEIGVGGSVKAGVDWSPSRPRWLLIRLAGRYQLFSAGVDLPHDVIIHLMTMVRF